MNKTLQHVKKLWTTTDYSLPDVGTYAEKHLLAETRIGLMGMSFLLLLLVLAAIGINAELDFGSVYFNTYLVVLFLSAHICLSSRSVNELKTLNMLGITLLVLSATAFLSIAHQTEAFTPLLLSNIVLLFMLVPVIPWGLREALAVIMLIYFMITMSVTGRADVFDSNAMWSLQFIMLGAGIISASIVAFNVSVRRGNLTARFELEKAHDRMYRLSNLDPLTGVWNRRFIDTGLAILKDKFPDGPFHYAIFDLDAFKELNDTYGHDCGDKILRLVCDCFSKHVGDTGFLIRMGGDEFILLVVTEDLELLFNKIMRDIQQQLKKERLIKKGNFGLSLGLIKDISFKDHVSLEVLYKTCLLYTSDAADE